MDVSDTMMPHDPCPPGIRMRKDDKVVKQETLGNLSFGQILDVDGELIAVWNDGSKDDLSLLLHSDPPIVAVYDRPFLIGARVRHLGKEGQVCGTNPIVTAYLAGQEGLFILPQLRDHLLHPILECNVGDTVICNGWVGVITEGTVDITYKYTTGKHDHFVTLKSSLKDTMDHQYYPRMAVGKISYDVLKKGSWSSGLTMMNAFSYRTKTPVIHRIQLSSLVIEWYDRIGSEDETNKNHSIQPPSFVSGKEEISKLFGLNENTSLEEKFAPSSVWTVRYDENLLENYVNWREAFVEEMILKGDKMGESEPSYKRAKHTLNISSLSRVAVKVMFYQTEVEVLFDDGSVLTTLSTNLMEQVPSKIPSCPSQDRRYLLGEVVKDRTDFIHPDKYGFIFSQNYSRRTVLVKWISLQRDGSVLVQEPQEMSQYDVVPLYKYSLLKNTPQIVVAKQKFEGMVKSVCLVEGKVKVQCAEGPVKSFWAHELEFCKKKAFYSPHKGWVPRDIPLPLDSTPLPLYCMKNVTSAKLKRAGGPPPRKFLNGGSPEDNHWAKGTSFPDDDVDLESTSLSALSTDLDNCMSLGTSIFIEKFNLRKDIFTIVYVPSNENIYQDVPFFLDCKVSKEYPSPHALPLVVVRLPRIQDPTWIHPTIGSDGQICFPEELKTAMDGNDGLGPVARALKYLMDNVFGNIEPYLGLRESVVVEVNENNNKNNWDEDTSSGDLRGAREYNEAGLIALTEYMHGLMCSPPEAWKSWIESHFKENLFRMCWRYIRFMEPLEVGSEETLVALNRQKGMKYLLYPVSESFRLALKSRVDNLSSFIELSPRQSSEMLN